MRQALRVRGAGRGGKDPGIENVRDQRLPQVQVRWSPCGRGSPEDPGIENVREGKDRGVEN